jgi:hypothetical protein
MSLSSPSAQQQQKNDFFALFLVFFATDTCFFAVKPSTFNGDPHPRSDVSSLRN